jgi:competence protein ComEC
MRPNTPFPWNTCPALLVAAGLVLGIGLACHSPSVPLWMWGTGIGLGIGMALATLYMPPVRMVQPWYRWRPWALAFLVVATGGARYALERSLPAHHVGQLFRAGAEEAVVTLTGTVDGIPETTAFGTRLTLAVHRVALAHDTLDATGKVLVTLSRSRNLDAPPFPALLPGMTLGVHGSLRALSPRRNPADFDYAAWLRHRGIHARMTLYVPTQVTILGQRSHPDQMVMATRARVQAHLERHVPDAAARDILMALLLGERNTLATDIEDAFIETGLVHLLAVSGLHILLVGMVLYHLLGPLLLRLGLRWNAMAWTRAVITLTLITGYVFLTGNSASGVRALLMAGLLIGQTLVQRNTSALNTLGTAALGMLLFAPSWLFDIGFQLSFAAVASLVLLPPVFHRALPEGWDAHPPVRAVVQLLTASLAASLGTLPILLWHFGKAPMAGLVLNLVAIPCTNLAMIAGMGTVLTGGFVADAFGAAASLFIRLLLATAHQGQAWMGWASLNLPVQSPWLAVALTSAVLMLARWFRPRARWRLAATGLGSACLWLWIGVGAGTWQPRLEVLFFDVGQGDAALITLPNGRHLLVDAGLRDPYTDQGRRTLLPHLERMGIHTLDAVVVTHWHGDHAGGLPAVLRTTPVRRLLHNGSHYPSGLFQETMHVVDSLHIPHQAVQAGDTLHLDPAVHIQVLWPQQPAHDADGENDASVVLRIVYGKTSFLLTGDAEAWTETRLTTALPSILDSDVVKVAHHGSATSSTAAFVEQVAQEGTVAVISVGKHNLFRHPSPAVVGRWEAARASVRTTAAQGAVWLRSDGRQVQEVAWRQ